MNRYLVKPPALAAASLVLFALGCGGSGGSPSTGSNNNVEEVAPPPDVKPPTDGARVQLLQQGDCWGDEYTGGMAVQAPAEDDDSMVAPKLLAEGRPVYPSEARKDKEQGLVIVEALVGPDGKVVRACVNRGVTPKLNTAAVEAATRSRFEAGTMNGEPTAMWVQLPYNFKL